LDAVLLPFKLIWKGLTMAWNAIIDLIMFPIKWLWKKIKKTIKKITNAFFALISSVSSVFKSTKNFIKGLWKIFTWDNIKFIFQRLWEKMLNWFSFMADYMSALFSVKTAGDSANAALNAVAVALGTAPSTMQRVSARALTKVLIRKTREKQKATRRPIESVAVLQRRFESTYDRSQIGTVASLERAIKSLNDSADRRAERADRLRGQNPSSTTNSINRSGGDISSSSTVYTRSRTLR